MKQCKIAEVPSDDKKSVEHCFNSSNPLSSVYNYCDKIVEFDFYKKTRCKMDMCKLCCAAFDMRSTPPVNTSDDVYNYCNSQCVKSKSY